MNGFFRARKFELKWDGKTREKGKTNLRAPQGSPLSPIIFLIWMAPIIGKMEIAIREVAPYDNEIPSYIDDLHVNICNWNRIHVDMELLLKRIDEVVNRIAKENHLHLKESKHETLVLSKKRRQKNKDVKWVKWIAIIIDESLSFKEHWKSRIAKARKMLGQLNGLGNLMWEISANSWRSAYAGMLRAVALWGAELGWRGQRNWEEEFEKLQYQALKKCVYMIHGSRRELVSQIAAVESRRMALDAAQARVMGKLMRNPSYIDDL